MSIKHDHTLHPITALAFYESNESDSLLLAAEGPFLKIFEAQTSGLIHQCQIFKDQTVHGIVVQEDVASDDALQVVIWGGYSILTLSKNEFVDLLHQKLSTPKTAISTASDWILDVAISPQNETSCALVTAHNTVIEVTKDPRDHSTIFKELHSPSKSILYSAHLIWETSNTLLIAAGTVFGEIIAWKCLVSQDGTAQSEGRILSTFTGHEGSIFGVDISPSITLSNNRVVRLLASCSDDRTIRVWDLASDESKDEESNSSSLRETGFGDNGQNATSECVAVAMGHASRIWRVKFLFGLSKTDPVDILSFGEDSTVYQWSLKVETHSQDEFTSSSSLLQGQLLQQRILAFHAGKHIWSSAICQEANGEISLATGGADGKIVKYSINVSGDDPSFRSDSESKDEQYNMSELAKHHDWDLSEILATLPSGHEYVLPPQEEALLESVNGQAPAASAPKKKPKKVPKDSFNRYAFASDDEILLTTTFGRVLLGNLQDLSWKDLALPEDCKDDLKSWSVVKGVPSSKLVFIAGTSGRIYATQQGMKIAEIGKVAGKVADMFVVSDLQNSTTTLLVTNLYAKQITSFIVSSINDPTALSDPKLYDLPEGFIVTSAGKVGKHLVLGSRYGRLVVYDEHGNVIDNGDADSTLHGDAVTAIVGLPASTSEVGRLCFLTTGRKGMYSIFALNSSHNAKEQRPQTLSLVHQGSPPFGPMIEHAWYTKDRELILYGFKSKNFIVWNETQQAEIMSVECGGAHRSYSYFTNDKGGSFLYTKASRLYLYQQPERSHQIIKPGGHGREIKACAVSRDQRLIATGAEDTAIRIWTYADSNESNLHNQLCNLAVVQKHTAGIQHLQWHESTYLFSSGGNEEFFIWAVSKLPTGGVGIMCEANCPDQSEDCDLRIMSFDITEFPSGDNVETRFLITLAYSDSTFKAYSYSKSQRYRLIAKGRYTSSCLMQIKNLVVEDNRLSLLIAATDGVLTVWSAYLNSEDVSTGQEFILHSAKKVHQSSVKSMDVATSTHGDRIIVATGGDDDALGITIYDRSKLFLSPTLPIKVAILRSAHAAAVTGLTFVNSHTSQASDEFVLVSSSNDQRVKEWRVVVANESEVEIRKAGDVFTPVADVGDVACLRTQSGALDGKVLVVGNGMEVWNVGRGYSR